METVKSFEHRINVRIFNEEYEKIKHFVKTVKCYDGTPKYENSSHFMRCGMMKLIHEEEVIEIGNKLIKKLERTENERRKSNRSNEKIRPDIDRET